MRIEVEILPWLSSSMRPGMLGSIRFEHRMAGSSFRELLEELAEVDPAFARIVYDREAGELRYPSVALVNKRFVEMLRGLDTKLADGDSVTIMATYTGG